MTKKILLISYHFPPSQAVGGLRVANFARYLPQSGWMPYVLTVKDKYIPNLDYDGLHALENVTIYKTITIPKAIKLYQTLKSLCSRIYKRKKFESISPPTGMAPRQPEDPPQETVVQRTKRYFASLFLALPDYEKNWILPATFKAIREIRRQHIDCILTSCPPYSVHLIGLLANMVTGVKWIADFRDPWYVASKKRMYPTCLFSRKIESVLEGLVIKRASFVVCNTDKLRDTLAKTYGESSSDKFIYLPNGISTEFFEKIGHLRKYDKFTLTYTGSLYFFRTPEPIFKSLKELIDEGLVPPDEIRIKLIGHCQSIDGYPTEKLVDSYALNNVVEVLPPVPYKKALEIVTKSHLALLFAPDQPYQIPAKVYDYIGTGTKILALAGDGATADMVQNTKSGRVFHSDNLEGIKKFIVESISCPMDGEEMHRTEVLDMFDRKRIVGKFSGYLDKMLI
jgi:hypothetical protein